MNIKTLIAVLLLAGAAAAGSAYGAVHGSGSPAADRSVTAGGLDSRAEAAAGPASAGLQAARLEQSDRRIKEEIASQWAEGWRTRDGRLRLAVMGRDLSSDFRSRQLADTGDADQTVIRWSSPWVVSSSTECAQDSAVISYVYTDSAGGTYISSEVIQFGEEDGRTVVTASETLAELQEQ